jgi:hypothetical protein
MSGSIADVCGEKVRKLEDDKGRDVAHVKFVQDCIEVNRDSCGEVFGDRGSDGLYNGVDSALRKALDLSSNSSRIPGIGDEDYSSHPIVSLGWAKLVSGEGDDWSVLNLTEKGRRVVSDYVSSLIRLGSR